MSIEIDQQIQLANEQQEQLSHLKENYTIESLLAAQENNAIDVETMFIPTSFKRLSFMGAKTYKVNESDFYGNIIIETDQPKMLSAISLMAIHKLVESGYDRYGVILSIKNICQHSFNTDGVIKGIQLMMFQAKNPTVEP